MIKRQIVLWGLILMLTPACGELLPQKGVTPLDCSASVATVEGVVSGAPIRSGCTYKGIPYAAPPVGDLRFRAPQPPISRATPLAAVEYAPECLQLNGADAIFSPRKFSEDCLYLNIWRPNSARSDAKLPVMAWIYGGGFVGGGSAWSIYDGADMIENNVVLVTLNYRLGPVGFLANAALAADSSDGSVGNYGLRDQIAALQWVKKNIESFGGDPQRITIFGESAGGFSVCALMASPLASGLFERAIMESGICVSGEPRRQYYGTVTWITEQDCPVTGPESVACMRALTEKQLVEDASYAMGDGYFPLVDGTTLQQQPIVALESGSAARVPFIAGNNSEELKAISLLPQFMSVRSMPWSEFWNRLQEVFSVAEIDRLQSLYPQADYSDPIELWADALNDQVFGCAAAEAVRGHSQYAPSWLYRFGFIDSENLIQPYTGAFHGVEVPFVFGNVGVFNLIYSSQEGLRLVEDLSARIQRYWTRFAATGDPNGAADPTWSPYGSEHTIMHLSIQPEPLPGFKSAACDFWISRLPREINDRLDWLLRAPRAVDAEIPGF